MADYHWSWHEHSIAVLLLMPQGDHIRVDDAVVSCLGCDLRPDRYVLEQAWSKDNQDKGATAEQVGPLVMGRMSSIL